MDQNNRPDLTNNTNNNHQQNVHLHMHHVCACQGLYPSSYYPPIGYRTPLISYAAPQSVARPYLQHYQYTQFNVGGQYNMPMTQLSTYGTAAGGGAAAANPQGAEGGMQALPSRERRDRTDESGAIVVGGQESDKNLQPEPPSPDFDFSTIIPPVNELFMMNNSDDFQMNTDNFIKFLERSCLTAEQIAYRNRNRPCFRNIQNLCIRTRSEILKPRTTISNIHSQGIPWATKDFIYAFVRLTNCWHILKGYWENREGSALGKIEKELTPGFKACYVRWEKETVELATELTRIFYNLDVNQSNPGPTVNVHTANNLVPPQVSLLKVPTEVVVGKKLETLGATSTVTSSSSSTVVVVQPSTCNSKNVRGILHLPSSASGGGGGGVGGGAATAGGATVVGGTETVDQANQTCSGDFCGKSDEILDSDEDNGVVYMKPGSYRVPKKYKNKELMVNNKSSSPRVIEFLETAQNVTKGLEAANDKYWVKVKTTMAKKAEPKLVTQTAELEEVLGDELNSEASFFNVHEWLSNSNFSDYAEQSSTSTSPPKCGGASYFPDLLAVDEVSVNNNHLDSDKTLLQQQLQKKSRCQNNNSGSNLNNNTKPSSSSTNNNSGNNNVSGLDQITSRTYRRKTDLNLLNFELKGGGLTKRAKTGLEKIVADLKGTELVAETLQDCVLDCVSLDSILKNISRDVYRYVCEVVRDLRIVGNLANQHFKGCEGAEDQVRTYLKKLESCLSENFSSYDFNGVVGVRGEKVGRLRSKSAIFDGDGDHNLKNSN